MQIPNHQPIVYYMGGEELGVVKIGTTVNVERRFKTFKRNVGTEYEPKLLAWEFGGPRLEGHRHSQFSGKYRIFGDWFLLQGDLEEHIDLLYYANGDEVEREICDCGCHKVDPK